MTNSDRDVLGTGVPSSARIRNYWLGGKDKAVDLAGEARAYLGRVVRFLADEVGVRQFMDVGTGLPAENDTHEVAQLVAPECRIVYVDHDPILLGHARTLLVGTSEGSAQFLEADMRDRVRVGVGGGGYWENIYASWCIKRGSRSTRAEERYMGQSAEPGHCHCGDADTAPPELDVRLIPHSVRHGAVLGAFDAVPSGGSLVLVAPHDPLPLLRQLDERAGGRLSVEYLQRGPDAWRLKLTR